MNKPLSNRWRKLRWSLAALLCLLAAGLVLSFFSNADGEASQFVAVERALFRNCHTLQDAQRVADFTRTFPDQTWVAVVSKGACTEGFNATVFYDSRGIIQVNQKYHFCGLEGLESELERVTANTLGEFYAELRLRHCQLTQFP